jgi:hypothetical protein
MFNGKKAYAGEELRMAHHFSLDNIYEHVHIRTTLVWLAGM